MYEYIAEAFAPVSHAPTIIEKVCARYGTYCRSIGTTRAGTLLDFGDAQANLRPTIEGLHFRVEARNPIIFLGIRTLLQGSLSAITTFPVEAIEWRSAGGVPFDAMQGHLGNWQGWPGER
jgi:hypothetical protein